MSRMEKFGSRRSRRRMKSAATVVEAEVNQSYETYKPKKAENPISLEKGTGEKDPPLPPRSTRAVPRNSGSMTAWFYRLLIALFILLAGGLLMWGKGLYDD